MKENGYSRNISKKLFTNKKISSSTVQFLSTHFYTTDFIYYLSLHFDNGMLN